jgi:hypothetical protein
MNRLATRAASAVALASVVACAAIATATAVPLVAAAAPAPRPVPATPAAPAPALAPMPEPAVSAKAAATIENCASQQQSEPTEVTLFCADANDTLTRIAWKHWGRTSASASAVDVIDLCEPSCVAGRNHDYRVAVSVSDLHSYRGGQRYERLTVTFAGKPPKGTSRVEHFEIGAHGPVIA